MRKLELISRTNSESNKPISILNMSINLFIEHYFTVSSAVRDIFSHKFIIDGY